MFVFAGPPQHVRLYRNGGRLFGLLHERRGGEKDLGILDISYYGISANETSNVWKREINALNRIRQSGRFDHPLEGVSFATVLVIYSSSFDER